MANIPEAHVEIGVAVVETAPIHHGNILHIFRITLTPFNFHNAGVGWTTSEFAYKPCFTAFVISLL